MERIRFVTYQNSQVLLIDCTNCTEGEISALADELPKVVTKEPPGSVLLLADFTGAKFDKESVEHVKIAAVFDRPHVQRSAWVLNENLPKALYDSIRTFSQRDLPIFHTRQEALDYLVG